MEEKKREKIKNEKLIKRRQKKYKVKKVVNVHMNMSIRMVHCSPNQKLKNHKTIG